MLASYVLRLVTDELDAGRLVGEVVSVTTGRTETFHGADALVAFCREEAPAIPAQPGEAR